MDVPQGRYKIVERDRRLVTIDTLTGEEVGLGGAPKPVDQRSSATMPAVAGANQSGRAPAVPTPSPSPPLSSDEHQGRTGRIMLILVGATALLIFLILSGAWIPAVIITAVPQLRTPIWKLLSGILSRYVNHGSIR